MKNRNKIVQLCTSVLLVLCCLSVACNDDDIEASTNCLDKNNIVGSSWSWVQTQVFFNPSTTNPTTEGYTRCLEFKADGTLLEYKNSVLEKTTTYEIVSTNTLKLDSTTWPYTLQNGELVLDLSPVDGPRETYSCGCD